MSAFITNYVFKPEHEIPLYKELGRDYTAEQLMDVHFLYQEIARLGYSVSLTTTTLDSYLQIRASHKLLGEPDVVEYLKAHFVMYTYQLLGGAYTTRGSHNSPICENPAQALKVALYNLLVIHARGV